MKKSKNYVWLVLGIITILIGLILPFVLMSQSAYFESSSVADNVDICKKTYNITIYSKEEMKDVDYVVITFKCKDREDREYEVNSVKTSKDGNKYVYSVVCVTDNIFVEDVDKIEVVAKSGVYIISEKVGFGTKISIAIFICVVGGFMIFVHFFNRGTKSRTAKLKEIISSSSNENSSLSAIDEIAPKICTYCGTIAEDNDKICSSCGAKLK